jgi:hypothetical protein
MWQRDGQAGPGRGSVRDRSSPQAPGSLIGPGSLTSPWPPPRRRGWPQHDRLAGPAGRPRDNGHAPVAHTVRPNAANMMSAIRSAISSSGSWTSALIR